LTTASLELTVDTLQEELAAHDSQEEDLLRSRVLELEFKHRDGFAVPAEVKIALVRGPDRRPAGIVGVARDIRERKRADAERADLQVQLLQAQKMEAIGVLAGGVAHDFNNLLTAVVGYSDLLLSRLDEDDSSRHELEEIRLAGERAAWLTHQLLAFSRKQVLKPQALDSNALIDRLGKLLRRLIGEDIELVITPNGKDAQIWGDRGQIEQVIMNLALNAKDAMPEGGRLTIGTESVTIDGGQFHSDEGQAGDFVCISVTDSGSGMDKETVQRIFEPFFTTKDVGAGTGLGLSVVHGIVEQHNGWITVESQAGHGTTFKVFLAACDSQTEDEGRLVTSMEEFQGNGERILLLEDEQGVRALATRVLRESGYTVFGAKDADEAMEIFRREEGKLDLVFTDVVLPGQNGLQFIEGLRSAGVAVPFLLTSGYTDHEPRRRAIQDNGFRFLNKPYTIVEMLSAVGECIETHV
jgi:signal transduction histidine kinase/CheY-like chemotaxis protein